jgi:hypothetical protein
MDGSSFVKQEGLTAVVLRAMEDKIHFSELRALVLAYVKQEGYRPLGVDRSNGQILVCYAGAGSDGITTIEIPESDVYKAKRKVCTW